MADLTSLVTGLSQGISGYLGNRINTQNQMALNQQQSDLDTQKQITVAKATKDINTPTGPGQGAVPLTRDMAEQALPGYGGKMVDDYNSSNPGQPLTMQQGWDYIKNAHELLNPSKTDDKQSKQQDTLEEKYKNSLISVRGDQSLLRAEHQRDSAGFAYDTIAKAESENRPLTELEQTDLIGQLWQARTGKAPTDNDMKMLNDRTAKRGFNHIVTYLTGDPGIVGSSTPETLANLKQFVQSTGAKADQQWEAYMGPRMSPPSGLDADRVEHVRKNQRGISFADQMATSNKTYSKPKPNKDNLEAKKAALRAKLEL